MEDDGIEKMEEDGWNLSRFCNKLNTSIIGGASKLLKHFKRNYNPTRIISYADKDWSMGNLYEKLNFELVKDSNPDYKYLYNNKRIHKSNFKKSSIKKKFGDINVSESIFLTENGIHKIWDCGKLKYEQKIRDNQ